MVASAVVTPNLLTDPGYLFIAPVGTAAPANTVAGSIFTDSWPVAWLPLGATENGSEFSYATTVSPLNVEEFFDPIVQRVTARMGHIAFNLANWSLTNYRRSMNGGLAAMTAFSGTAGTSLFTVSPPAVGTEVRCAIGWESLDNTVRLVVNQTIQGGDVKMAFKKAPGMAVIPCSFQMEFPPGGQPFQLFSAGVARG